MKKTILINKSVYSLLAVLISFLFSYLFPASISAKFLIFGCSFLFFYSLFFYPRTNLFIALFIAISVLPVSKTILYIYLFSVLTYFFLGRRLSKNPTTFGELMKVFEKESSFLLKYQEFIVKMDNNKVLKFLVSAATFLISAALIAGTTYLFKNYGKLYNASSSTLSLIGFIISAASVYDLYKIHKLFIASKKIKLYGYVQAIKAAAEHFKVDLSDTTKNQLIQYSQVLIKSALEDYFS